MWEAPPRADRIYLAGDQQVGQWSAEQSVTAGG
jgi:hypothetical protein